jgi:hypothetical protein
MEITAQSFLIKDISRVGPLFLSRKYNDTKDPCPLFDGSVWHIYGSGGKSGDEVWKILHATSSSPLGPWIEEESVLLDGIIGDHVAAPGVVFDPQDHVFHMFIQKDFLALGGTVEHLVSTDGQNFKLLDTPLQSITNTNEAGIYDPHPAEINGEKYIVYAATDSFIFTGTYYIG